MELAGGVGISGGVGIVWKLQLMGAGLIGGLDLCNHVNKWIFKSTLSWFVFSTEQISLATMASIFQCNK